jgi:hypothetical protein
MPGVIWDDGVVELALAVAVTEACGVTPSPGCPA